MAAGLMVLPFLILWGLVLLLPPWHDAGSGGEAEAHGAA